MSLKTDAKLVEMVRERGDMAAYGKLVERYQGHVYGLAYSILGHWTEAQDIAQEAFIRAYINLHTLNKPEKFSAWLRRIVFSMSINWLQRHRPELYQSAVGPNNVDEIDVLPDTNTATPIEHTLKNEMSKVVLLAIADLPQKYRIPLAMFHLDGLSYKKVADFLEIPIGTVKTFIHRAKERLKPVLEPYAQEVLPMIKDVFDEHKLTEQFAQRTLKSISENILHGVDTPKRLKALLGEMRLNELEKLLTIYEQSPIIRTNELEIWLLHEYYYQMWLDIFKAINLDTNACVLEVASGTNVKIARALDRHSKGNGFFVAANLNKKHSAKLSEYLSEYSIGKKIIEDDAINLSNYYQDNTFDLIGMNHAINDMFEYLAAKSKGIDTVNEDWNYNLMIQCLEEVYKQGDLESKIKNEFIETIKTLYRLLKPDCYMIMNNYVFQELLKLGGTFELYDSFIDIVRDWIHTSGLKFKEIELDGLSKKYWLLLRKLV